MAKIEYISIFDRHDCRRQLTRNGRDYINLSTLRDGVYAVHIITDQRATTGSTLI